MLPMLAGMWIKQCSCLARQTNSQLERTAWCSGQGADLRCALTKAAPLTFLTSRDNAKQSSAASWYRCTALHSPATPP
jgi:hypothetical protein